MYGDIELYLYSEKISGEGVRGGDGVIECDIETENATALHYQLRNARVKTEVELRWLL